MSYDDDWPDQTLAARREALRNSIRPATVDELKKLGEKRFPIVTDPWCVRYFEFLGSHPDGRYFIAESAEHAEVIYCSDSKRGVWFLPGQGMGIVQAKGLAVLAEITAGM